MDELILRRRVFFIHVNFENTTCQAFSFTLIAWTRHVGFSSSVVQLQWTVFIWTLDSIGRSSRELRLAASTVELTHVAQHSTAILIMACSTCLNRAQLSSTRISMAHYLLDPGGPELVFIKQKCAKRVGSESTLFKWYS